MSERFVAVKEGWENFRAGGGVKTIVRRFAQTAPFAAAGLGAGGFFVGELGPAFVEISNTTNTNPHQPIASPYTPEYGMPWAVTGAEIGLAGAAIEALIHPFFVGAAINRGELDDIPPMPNIGHHALYGLRRGFDHVINLRRDFHEGGGWQEFSSNLAVFGSGGSVLGLLGGMSVDAMATANTSTEFMPIESSLAGIAVGALVGGYTAVEVTAGEGRRIRREDEGLTTLRRLLRRKRGGPEAARQEGSRQVPVLTPAGEELVQEMKQIYDPSERAQHLGQDLRTLLAQQQSGSSQDSPS